LRLALTTSELELRWLLLLHVCSRDARQQAVAVHDRDSDGLLHRKSPAPSFRLRRPAERPVNNIFYAVAHEPKEIWEIPGSKHIGGTEAQPVEYERRVTAFFDRELRPQG
jgi:hypothetical protein